ncbi:MAG: hypothetical protein WDM90_24120 [Ferruginibacter sp.]
MKQFLLPVLLFFSCYAKAQKVDSIYVHLYTDSLKKGTYNYINVDGLLSNGRYLPLDSSQILFTASVGKFFGNSLFIDKNFTPEKVTIKASLKANAALYKQFDIYVKKKPDEDLKTLDEIMNAPPKARTKKGN